LARESAAPPKVSTRRACAEQAKAHAHQVSRTVSLIRAWRGHSPPILKRMPPLKLIPSAGYPVTSS